MATWSADELAILDRVGEIRVGGRRDDGSVRKLVIIWHVVVDGALYARSVRGEDGKWYQGVLQNLQGAIRWGDATHDVVFVPDSSHNAAIDAAYVAKYGSGSATRSITTALATATTLRIDPKA